jgi:hypothetical protein
MEGQNNNTPVKPHIAGVNFNQDEAIEKFSETAGAYAGAAVAATISGLATLGIGLFRGAVTGVQNTIKNNQPNAGANTQQNPNAG